MTERSISHGTVGTKEGRLHGLLKQRQDPRPSICPPALRYDADCLDEHGRWDLVIYEGAQRWFWRPTSVYIGWSPFTAGIWTEWCGDQTWIPAEPFGYVTHHYGNWVFVGNFWYWAPPVVSVRIGFPVLDIGFFWNPGRVAWIHRGIYVGWVPLAPHEKYYSHRDWGDHRYGEVVNKSINQINININVRNYTYINRAVIVNNKNFHGVEDYRNVRVANVHPTIINRYNVAPVVNNAIINNYETNRQRYKYTNATVQEKPHSTVLNRVRQNETTIRQGRKENVESLQQQVKSAREGSISRDARIETPKAADYLVPAEDADRPRSEIMLRQREVKNSRDTVQDESPEMDVKSGRQAGQTGQAVSPPEQVSPSKSGQVERPSTRSKTLTPAKPSEAEKPSVQTDRSATPDKTTRKQKSAQQPEQAAPAESGQVERPAARTKAVTPAMSDEEKKRAAQRDRVFVPAKTTQQEKPARQSEQATPAKSGQVERSSTQSKTLTPPKSNEAERLAVQTNRTATPAKPASDAGSVSASATQTEKVTDKTRRVERSVSAIQKRKAQKNSDENGEHSESGATENPDRR